MIENAYNDAMAQAHPESDGSGLTKRYDKVNQRDFDGQAQFVSEMDALIAYLQALGTFVNFKDYQPRE
jgi:cytochrome c oxidase cbb3-type subunit 2